ncbi:RING/U-box superfamily protein [Trifolium repens]|jgi:E3 ubiquitin-protein ligase RHA2|nr:RING/U-box superfamily protein [Trifolium repens]
MLIELILIICYLKSYKNPITTTQYLNLIEEKNPTRRLKKPTKDHKDCRVCLSEFEEGDIVRNLDCEHTFHKDCLDKWFLQDQYCATCPLCRNHVLSDDFASKYYLPQNQVELHDDQFRAWLSSLRGSSILFRYL